MSRKDKLAKSFGHAFDGIKAAAKNEPNFQIHLIIATIVCIAGLAVGMSVVEWLILVFTIGFVLILELINTAVEAIVNLVSPDIHHQAKIAKDVSAAAVLIAAILAICVGTFLFIPKIYGLVF
jgi:undecaprenol kinase